MNAPLVRRILEREEGWREKPYRDTEGYPTVGYGFKIADKNAPLPDFILPKQAGDAWLDSLIDDLRVRLSTRISSLNEARQAIILSMCYQMGTAGVFAFKRMWAAIETGDFESAATEMLDSKWARQTPVRAQRHAFVMRSGSVEGVY